MHCVHLCTADYLLISGFLPWSTYSLSFVRFGKIFIGSGGMLTTVKAYHSRRGSRYSRIYIYSIPGDQHFKLSWFSEGVLKVLSFLLEAKGQFRGMWELLPPLAQSNNLFLSPIPGICRRPSPFMLRVCGSYRVGRNESWIRVVIPPYLALGHWYLTFDRIIHRAFDLCW